MRTTLLADIGGTNIRFALLKNGVVEKLLMYPHEKSFTAEKAIRQYLHAVKAKPSTFVVGGAGPLQPNGKISLTNRRFVLNLPKLCKTFGFNRALIANDMAFHGVGVLDLPDTQKACVIFVGTGMGVSFIQDGVVFSTEMGSEPILRPQKEEKAINAKIWEDVISGPAFLKIYKSLKGNYKPVMQSREVSYLAHNVHDPYAIKTYEIIAKCLARLCLYIVKTYKVSVFYMGGQLVEILRLPIGQDVFFDSFGKVADALGIRIIRPSDQTAMKGLKIIADDLAQTGTTKRINPNDFYAIG